MIPHKKRIISTIQLRGYIKAVVEQQMYKHWPQGRHSSMAGEICGYAIDSTEIPIQQQQQQEQQEEQLDMCGFLTQVLQ
ncbi:uncharacterized protein DMAD_13635 [Drosophila madeirensis]|uniref:Uncharacterized protein n=1 Tax=Drosophila madeirensis TaxID=30013 RepID=A0AAU9GF39_DROMD